MLWLGSGLEVRLRFKVKVRLKCNAINRGVRTHHSLSVRVLGLGLYEL